jgi:hypothetical protein
MPEDEDKSTVAERLTGRRDPQDPDGLITVEQAENPPDPARYGSAAAHQDVPPGDADGTDDSPDR